MFEVQMYEVAIRHGESDLMLRVARDDLDAVLRSLTSSGVEAFHVRRIPMDARAEGATREHRFHGWLREEAISGPEKSN